MAGFARPRRGRDHVADRLLAAILCAAALAALLALPGCGS